MERGCLVFAKFLDAVGAGGARAKDLEYHHDRFADDRFAQEEAGCNADRSVGVTDAAHDLDFHGRADRPALLTAKS